MAFNFDEFAGAFFETVAGGMQQNRLAAEKYKEQQEAAAQRNAQLIQQRDQRARQAAQLGKRAMMLGATDEQVRVAMSSGVTGISEFYEKLSAAAAQQPGGRLGPDDIEAVIKMPEIPAVDLNMADMTLEDFAKRTYGVGAKAAPVEDDTSFVRGLFGLDAKTRAKQQLADTEYMGGMSIADINAAAAQAEYASLIPGATMSFVDIDYFTPEKSLDFSQSLSKTMSDAVTGTAAKDFIESARRAAIESGDDVATAEEKARKYLQVTALKPIIDNYARVYYAGGFFDDKLALKQIEDAMGKRYLDELKASFNVYDSEEGEQPNEAEGEGTPPEGTKPETAPKVEVTLEATPEEGETLVTDEEFPAATPLDEEGKAIVEDALSSKSIMRSNKYSDKYTRAQWDEMSRKQRRERDLPESPVAGLNFYFRDDIDEIIEKPLRNLNIKRNIDKETYKVKIKGRGTYHVTAEQLASMDDAAFRGTSPAIEIIEYGEGEKKAKNITTNILKRFQVGE